MKYRKILLWLPAASVMLLIFFFSSQNGDNSSETSGGFARFLAELLHPDFSSLGSSEKSEIMSDCQFIIRKTAHFSIYAALGFSCALPLQSLGISSFSKRSFFSVCISAVYAVSDEIHQYFVPERSCRLTDVLIDSCGAFAGADVFAFIFFIIKMKNLKKNT
ncbi:MAG: VanZ family protein [Porcipelethomonas sp.]